LIGEAEERSSGDLGGVRADLHVLGEVGLGPVHEPWADLAGASVVVEVHRAGTGLVLDGAAELVDTRIRHVGAQQQLTADDLVISKTLDVDQTANLDEVAVAGNATFAKNIDVIYDNLPSKYRNRIIMGVATYNQVSEDAADKIKYTRITHFPGISLFSYNTIQKNPLYFAPIREALFP